MLTVILISLSSVLQTTAFKSGAPDGRCSSMIPKHGALKAGQGSFQITTSSNNITTQGSVRVTLTSTNNAPFKGFLLRPDPESLGTFTNPSSGVKTACSGSGITHTFNDDKTIVSADWKPSSSFNGSLKFLATVVEDYDNYLKDVQSADIQVSLVNISGASTNISKDPDCGVTKGCFYDCVDNDCNFVVTWKDVGDDIEFEVSSKISSGSDKWLALGFSTDTDMGDDSVVLCKAGGSGVTVEVGRNPGYFYTPLTDSSYGLSQTSGVLADAKMSCNFRRVQIPVGQPTMNDLSNALYLFVAHGNLKAGGEISKHSELPYVSPIKIDTTNSQLNISLQTQETTTSPTGTSKTPSDDVTKPEATSISDSECGKTKGCFPDCRTSECSYLVTWKNQPEHVQFEISFLTSKSSDVWVAIGLSKDDKMGDDSVVACVSDAGGVKAQVGYNTGYRYQALPNKSLGLSEVSGGIRDGIFRCNFRRAKTVTGESSFFDLNQRWQLIFAHGSSVSGNIRKHSTKPLVSDGTVDFLTAELVEGGQTDYILTKVHGSLMAIAWVLLSSVGIIIARFFKPAWPDSKLAGEKVWFQLHRTCMVGVFLCTVAGVIIIFVDIGGYSKIEAEDSMSFVKAHPVLGLVVASLTVLNPIMAIFRCSPGHKHRAIFNFFHRLAGVSAYILAAIAIVFASYLDRSGLNQDATYTMIAYIITVFVAVMVLEIDETIRKRKQKTFNVNTELTDINKINENQGRSEPEKKDTEDGMLFKKVVLVFLTLCMLGYTVALIVLISLTR